MDGTNVDDLGDDRPGLKAAREHGVRSPLLEAGFTKPTFAKLPANCTSPTGTNLRLLPILPRPRGITITSTLARGAGGSRHLIQEGFRRYAEYGDYGDLGEGLSWPWNCRNCWKRGAANASSRV